MLLEVGDFLWLIFDDRLYHHQVQSQRTTTSRDLLLEIIQIQISSLRNWRNTQITELRICGTRLEDSDDVAHFLVDLFKAKEMEFEGSVPPGMIPIDDVKDLWNWCKTPYSSFRFLDSLSIFFLSRNRKEPLSIFFGDKDNSAEVHRTSCAKPLSVSQDCKSPLSFQQPRSIVTATVFLLLIFLSK